MEAIHQLTQFFISNDKAIIEWLIICIIGLVILWILLEIFGHSSSEDSSKADFKEIKKSLRKILDSIKEIKHESTDDMLFPDLKGEHGENLDQLIKEESLLKENQKLDSTPLKTSSKPPSISQNEVNQQIQILNKMVEKKEAEMKNLADDKDEEKENLKKRIEELKRKLDGYDLIATDLANVSKIKKENEELKKKIQSKTELKPNETPKPLDAEPHKKITPPPSEENQPQSSKKEEKNQEDKVQEPKMNPLKENKTQENTKPETQMKEPKIKEDPKPSKREENSNMEESSKGKNNLKTDPIKETPKKEEPTKAENNPSQTEKPTQKEKKEALEKKPEVQSETEAKKSEAQSESKSKTPSEEKKESKIS